MQKLFFDTRKLDVAVREKYGLTEDIMMENAAGGIEKLLEESDCGRIFILCGKGNNGGDGYVLARHLNGSGKNAAVIKLLEAGSESCILQKARYEKTGGVYASVSELIEALTDEKTVVVDCVFGSGFHGSLPDEIQNLFDKINESGCRKIACDIPSGLDNYGNVQGTVFTADQTVTMGALKACLYSDNGKDLAGSVSVQNLGVSKKVFEGDSSYSEDIEMYLVEDTDVRLPNRKRQNVNKGSFGHVAVVCGEKKGAAVLSGCAALGFGCGLATVVSEKQVLEPGQKITVDSWGQNGVQTEGSVPYELMCSGEFPVNTGAVVCGMGLGRAEHSSDFVFEYLKQHEKADCVLDADLFYSDKLAVFLKENCTGRKVILTPHPKEAVELVKRTMPELYEKYGLEENGVRKLVENRVQIAAEFCTEYRNVVLLLKGANEIICVHEDGSDRTKLYVNESGCNALAKAGSGDVLAGMAGALLAQGYSVVDAAVTAAFAHGKASRLSKNSFSLTPFDVINNLKEL